VADVVVEMPLQGAQAAAMGNDQDPAVRMRACDALDGGEYTSAVLLTRLTARAVAEREALGDLGPGQPRPLPDVDLPQPRVGRDRQVVRCGEDFERASSSNSTRS